MTGRTLTRGDWAAAITAETSALLLASKSNYQNILEGTHLPGVSYPEALSTNLTSKRTSHKIAEQGRRNRINTALQEIATLLPSSATTTMTTPKMAGMSPTGEGGSGGSPTAGGTAAQLQSNSKASTVEMAIEYIKALQGELAAVKGQLALAQGRLGEGGRLELALALEGEGGGTREREREGVVVGGADGTVEA